MKRMSLVLLVGLLAATILSGCVIVPLGGWGWGYGDGGYYGGRGYYRGHEGGGYYRYHSSPYRPY